MSGPCTDCGGPDYQTLEARIAELEAHAEHDEDNIAGLEHVLVRANQRYTQAEAERDKLRHARLPCREAEVAQRRYEQAEAELAAVGSDLQDEAEYNIALRECAEQAEAERDALRAKWCGNCLSLQTCYIADKATELDDYEEQRVRCDFWAECEGGEG